MMGAERYVCDPFGMSLKIIQPSKSARVVPIKKPRKMRNKLAPRAVKRLPDVMFVMNELKMSETGGKSAGLLSG